MKNAKISQAPTEQEIAAYAYHLWESEGCVPGRDLDYWLQAEAHLRAHQKLQVDSDLSPDEPLKVLSPAKVSSFSLDRAPKPSKKRNSRPARQPAYA